MKGGVPPAYEEVFLLGPPMCHYWPRIRSSLTSGSNLRRKTPVWCAIPELQCALGHQSIATQRHPGGQDDAHKGCCPQRGGKRAVACKPSLSMGPLLRSSSGPLYGSSNHRDSSVYSLRKSLLQRHPRKPCSVLGVDTFFTLPPSRCGGLGAFYVLFA